MNEPERPFLLDFLLIAAIGLAIVLAIYLGIVFFGS